MPLKIAFLGYDERQTRAWFMQFAVDNREQVQGANWAQGYMRMKDGTEILRVPAANPAWIKSRRFDQIIVADDWRKNAMLKRWDELDALERCCCGSIIPEEFRYQFYNIDEEDPKNEH